MRIAVTVRVYARLLKSNKHGKRIWRGQICVYLPPFSSLSSSVTPHDIDWYRRPYKIMPLRSGVPRGVFNTPPPSEIPKTLQNCAKFNPILKTVKRIAEFRTPTPQDVRKKGSEILKLPSVRICFN